MPFKGNSPFNNFGLRSQLLDLVAQFGNSPFQLGNFLFSLSKPLFKVAQFRRLSTLVSLGSSPPNQKERQRCNENDKPTHRRSPPCNKLSPRN
jgi:hypothetical protein